MGLHIVRDASTIDPVRCFYFTAQGYAHGPFSPTHAQRPAPHTQPPRCEPPRHSSAPCRGKRVTGLVDMLRRTHGFARHCSLFLVAPFGETLAQPLKCA